MRTLHFGLRVADLERSRRVAPRRARRAAETVADPDGNRIELVQWPPGHPDGMTEADLSGA
jgi:hypothetical protein